MLTIGEQRKSEVEIFHDRYVALLVEMNWVTLLGGYHNNIPDYHYNYATLLQSLFNSDNHTIVEYLSSIKNRKSPL